MHLVAGSGVAGLTRVLLRISLLWGISRSRLSRIRLLGISGSSSGVTRSRLTRIRLLGIARSSGGVSRSRITSRSGGGVSRSRISSRSTGRVASGSTGIARSGGRVASRGGVARSDSNNNGGSSRSATEVEGSDTNINITLVLIRALQGQPTEPFETLDQIGEGQLCETKSLIGSECVLITNGKSDDVLILRVGRHLEGLLPSGIECLVLVVSLLNIVTPVELVANLDLAVGIGLAVDVGGGKILGLQDANAQ
jgi:hypothetical protein